MSYSGDDRSLEQTVRLCLLQGEPGHVSLHLVGQGDVPQLQRVCPPLLPHDAVDDPQSTQPDQLCQSRHIHPCELTGVLVTCVLFTWRLVTWCIYARGWCK